MEYAPLDEVIKQHVLAVYSAMHFNVTKTARALKVDRKKIYRLLKKYEVKK